MKRKLIIIVILLLVLFGAVVLFLRPKFGDGAEFTKPIPKLYSDTCMVHFYNNIGDTLAKRNIKDCVSFTFSKNELENLISSPKSNLIIHFALSSGKDSLFCFFQQVDPSTGARGQYYEYKSNAFHSTQSATVVSLIDTFKKHLLPYMTPTQSPTNTTSIFIKEKDVKKFFRDAGSALDSLGMSLSQLRRVENGVGVGPILRWKINGTFSPSLVDHMTIFFTPKDENGQYLHVNGTVTHDVNNICPPKCHH